MADDVVKRLLIKLGIDRSEFDNATKEIKRTMDSLYQAERAKSAQRKADAQSDAQAVQAQITAQKALKDATDLHLQKLQDAAKIRGKELDQMKEAVAQERVRLDAKSQVLRVMAQQGELQGQALRNLQQEVSLERSNLAIKQAQLRAAITASQADRRQGFAGGLLEGFSSRLAGTIGFSVISAEGLGRIFEMAYEKVKELGRALMEATGPAQTLRKEFEFLATGKGINAEALISKLRTATRGLVSDQQLIQTGSQFLRSNAKITADQFEQLAANVTKLARASGHDVQGALEALGRTMQTGRGYTLAYALGLTNVRELMVQGIPAGASEATRATLGLNQVMRALAQEAAKVTAPATTLPELFKQMHVQSENFIEGIAEGLTQTHSFQEAITNISNKLRDMQPRLEQLAKTVGEKLANAIKWVTDHFTELKIGFLALAAILTVDLVITQIDRWKAWGNVIGWVSKQIGLVKKATEELVAVEAVEKAVSGRASQPSLLGTATTTVESGLPGISPGIKKLLSTGKGGLAYGARSAQLSGGTAAEGDLFSGLEGLGELGTISQTPSTIPAMLSTSGAAGMGLGLAAPSEATAGLAIGGMATAGIVAAAVAAFAAITAALMAKNKATLREMVDGVKEVGDQIVAVMKFAWTAVANEAQKASVSIKSALTPVASLLEKIDQKIKTKTGKTLFDWVKDAAVDSYEVLFPWLGALDQAIKKLKQLGDEREKRQAFISSVLNPKPLIDPDLMGMLQRQKTGASSPEMNLSLERELAAERLKLAEETAKARFAIIKEELDNEEEALKSKYEIGLVDLGNYLDQEKALRKRELDTRLQEIESERQARIAQIRSNAKTVQTGEDGKQTYVLEDPSLTAAKEKAANMQAKEQSIQAEAQYQKQLAQLLFQRLQDEMAAQKTYESEVLKLRKEGIDAQTKALESHFKDGEVSAELYLQKREELIKRELAVELEAYQAEYNSSKKTAQDKAKFDIESAEARAQAEKQLAQLKENNDQIELQAAENRYKKELEFNTALQQLTSYQAQTGVPGATGQNIAVLQQGMDIEEQRLKVLNSMLDDMNKKNEQGSAEWFQVVKDIGDANARLVEFNKKLAEAKDIATPLANIFEQIAKIFGSSQTGKWLASLAQGMKELAQWSKQVSEQGGGKSQIRQLGSSFMGLFHRGGVEVPKPPKSPQEVADESTKKFAKSTDDAAKQLLGLAKSSKDTATKLQSDWQKAIENLNNELKAAADNLGGKFQPLIDAANNAAAALNNLAQSAGGKGGNQSQQGQFVAAGGSMAGLGGATNDNAQAPTNEYGVTGTLPGADNGASQISSILSDTAKSAEQLSASLKKPTSGLDQFAGKLSGLLNKLGGYAQGIGSFIQGISGAKSTGQGILSGAMGGMQFGAQFGPWGAAIGAAVGATIGGIVGHKEAIAQAQAEAIKSKLEQIKEQLANNTITMGAAIGQLEQLRSTVVSEMRSTGKKGNKAGLPQELQAINDQINQLLDEQKKILTDLSTQLGILLEPTQYQEILTNISEIISKYQQFASAAAGNTAAMTEANQWLVASLGQYATTMSNNVRSANEQAISDAEKLIDLQSELNNMQLQEYDILTRGVMGRQRSQAQQKGSEIEQVEQQKQQVQSEYQLQKYKVDAESKMFNLAQSRLGLEQQMVQLQEQDFDLWAAQVQAMQKTLGQLQSALGPGGTLPAGLLSATGGVNIQSLEQLLGLPITATGPAGVGQPYIQNEPAIFSEFVDIIDKNTSFKNFGTDLLTAAGTPFGSPQRQQLVNDLSANNYEIGHALINAGAIAKPVHGKELDPNWLNFFGWIMNQATAVNPSTPQGSVPTPTLPSIPGYETGGFVGQEGPAYLHAGEFVLPAPVVKYIKTAMSNMRKSFGLERINTAAPIFAGTFNNMGALNSSTIDTHQQVLDLTSMRIGMEHQLLSSQRQQTLLEMDRMSQMADLLNQMYKVQGSGVMSMEGAFAKVYELRGRYGSAGFRRETL